tara:strand:- start:339 stop:1028 length:690 start_codon:yes stop_codon:yes gene_type:complete
MNNYLLETKNISKSFVSANKKISLFNDVNFKIKKGDLIAVTGPSGSGKSTLLHILALLEQPTSGKLLISNEEVGKFKENQKDDIRKKSISIIFQNNNLLNDFTAIENILMPLYIKGTDHITATIKAKNILKDVKLSERANHFPSDLSGGEQQRVAIARALISNTELVLADEPTGNLDQKTSLDIFSYFQKLKRKNKAIIFATHNRELANKADYNLRIQNSKIIKVNGKR